MFCLQVLLEIAAVLVALIAIDVAPRACGALVEGGTRGHAVGHAARGDLADVGGAAAAVVHPADAQEASRRAGDVVDRVIQGRAVRVVRRPWVGSRARRRPRRTVGASWSCGGRIGRCRRWVHSRG